MKMPSLDGASIKRFFLYHCEKLILGLSVLLLGLFFWFGYSTKTFDESSPSKMVDSAKQANRYMTDQDAWGKIADLRQGDDEVIDRIMQVPDVEPASFDVGPASYPVKRDELRRDMLVLESPFQMELRPFVATTDIQPPNGRVVDPLAMFELVMPEVDEDGEQSDMGMGMPGGMGDMGDMGMGGMGGMPGGPGSGMEEDEDKTKSARARRGKKEEPVDAGTYVSSAVQYQMPGIRDTFGPTTVKAYNLTGVAVTGLVDHKKMWQNFKAMYSGSLGYHPDRDTPRYDFLEVQRRVVKDDGSTGEWADISNLLDGQRDFFPANFDTAPEVVSAPEHDGVITQPIPPFSGINYKEIAMHSTSTFREFKVPEIEEEVIVDGDDDFDKNQDDDETQPGGNRRRQSAIGSGSGGMGMGMGMGPGMGGPGGPGGMGPGMDMGMGMGMGPGMGGSPEGGRVSSDYTDYDIDIREEPTSDHKVLRFFDIHGVKSSVTYQYRVRVWIRDPNNEDPELASDISGGGEGMGMGMGPGMGGMGGMGGGKGGMGGMGGGGQDGEEEDPEKLKELMLYSKKTAIANNMIHPEARERLGKAREEKDKEGNKVYFVSEQQTNAAGENEWVEIQVPKNHDYLRFARPTMWSAEQEVTVNASPTFVYAGEPVKARRVLVGRGTVPDGEPSIKIAAGKLMQRGQLAGVKIPFKAEVKAGDLLDFNRPAHVLHPITRQVHKVTDVEVSTSSVVLDVAEGEELKMKKSSPIPYFYPGEVLVMNDLGKIELRSDLEDRGSYIAAILEKDDKASFGKKRRPKPSADEAFGGMGDMGGMGGMGPGGGR